MKAAYKKRMIKVGGGGGGYKVDDIKRRRKERVIVKERGREKLEQTGLKEPFLKTTKGLSKKEFRASRLLT